MTRNSRIIFIAYLVFAGACLSGFIWSTVHNHYRHPKPTAAITYKTNGVTQVLCPQGSTCYMDKDNNWVLKDDLDPCPPNTICAIPKTGYIAVTDNTVVATGDSSVDSRVMAHAAPPSDYIVAFRKAAKAGGFYWDIECMYEMTAGMLGGQDDPYQFYGHAWKNNADFLDEKRWTAIGHTQQEVAQKLLQQIKGPPDYDPTKSVMEQHKQTPPKQCPPPIKGTP